jgi:hypothetical protein
LEHEYGIQARVKLKDLSKSAAPSELHDEIIADGIEIAVLVNNAGFGYTGLMNRKKVIIPGAMNKLLAFSSRLMPRSLLANVARFLNQ